jgi:SAM-dependent methyltransferase
MAAAASSRDSSSPVMRCRLCGDTAELRYPGWLGWASNGALAPSSHEVGAYGDLYVCAGCGTVQPDELPSPELLAARYAQTEDTRYLDEETGRRRTAGRLLDLIERRFPVGRLLEVGCGHGLLLAEARVRGWKVTGLELSSSAAEYARQLDLEVREATIEQAGFADRSFDAVIAVDLLEHVPEPREFVSRCARLLVPGGALLIATPDPESMVAQLFGKRWWGYIPSHLHLVPRRVIRELLQAEGLVIADDVSMVRDFSFGYWVAGLIDRGGVIGRAALGFQKLPLKRNLALALGDQRVMVAQSPNLMRPAKAVATRLHSSPNVHAVLPAYKASATLPAVARELPATAINRATVVDDASPDDTVAVALQHGFEVIRHPSNRGYGANQKTCYAHALRSGADVVVMVHADNQYDPRLLPDMVRPIAEGRADVVIGSRLLDDQAIIGGMPRWKWIGNKLLTWIENRGFGRHFSEYHTGYRAFSADFLRSVPFLRNSDAFVFDQEIFAQAIAHDARVLEIAIPTRYFLEASSVSFRESVRYGIKTLEVLARFRAAQRGWIRWNLLAEPAFVIGTPDATRVNSGLSSGS